MSILLWINTLTSSRVQRTEGRNPTCHASFRISWPSPCVTPLRHSIASPLKSSLFWPLVSFACFKRRHKHINTGTETRGFLLQNTKNYWSPLFSGRTPQGRLAEGDHLCQTARRQVLSCSDSVSPRQEKNERIITPDVRRHRICSYSWLSSVALRRGNYSLPQSRPLDLFSFPGGHQHFRSFCNSEPTSIKKYFIYRIFCSLLSWFFH